MMTCQKWKSRRPFEVETNLEGGRSSEKANLLFLLLSLLLGLRLGLRLRLLFSGRSGLRLVGLHEGRRAEGQTQNQRQHCKHCLHHIESPPFIELIVGSRFTWSRREQARGIPLSSRSAHA